MRRLAFLAALLFFGIHCSQAQTITPWSPLYKGIESARGTNLGPNATFTDLMIATCLRIDLSDPDIQLLPTPPAPGYIINSRETLSASLPTYIRNTGVAVASDCNFYSPGDPSSEGVSAQLLGLSISKGFMVSPTDSGNSRTASLLFTTNNEAMIVYRNLYPGTNTAGIYSAVTGFYPVLSNGVNVSAWAVANYSDPTIHQVQPRTAFGLSQDRRYMFMLVIDGRQSGYSNGATDTETATWLQMFGAWDGINMDGGGSSAIYRNECGTPMPLTHSSLINGGRERYVGSHFGVYAKPLPGSVNDVKVTAEDTTASIQWTTPSPASGNINYGLTTGYGNSSAPETRQTTKHVATLYGLNSNTRYFFRINANDDSGLHVQECSFATSNIFSGTSTLAFNQLKAWKYNWNNLDGVNWTSPAYDDISWSSGFGLLYVQTTISPYVAPINTAMPGNPANIDAATGNPRPYPTYYFRTHFNMPTNPAGVSLTFSNNIDDGAIFYLNGSEFYRLRMPVGQVFNSTLASSYPCASFQLPQMGNACTNCPDVFTIPSPSLPNLVQGDNLLAVEAHNYNTGSGDLVFGSALYFNVPSSNPPRLNPITSEGATTVWWNGFGYTLQQASELGSNTWSDVSGPVTTSPYTIPGDGSPVFYRLRK